MCRFINKKPASILTGVACPFRGDRWNDFSIEQRNAGLDIGRKFWSQVLDDKIKMIVTLGKVATEMIVDIKNAETDLITKSGWADYNLKRYKSKDNVEIVQLLHLSTFKLFSRANCREPLKKYLKTLRSKFKFSAQDLENTAPDFLNLLTRCFSPKVSPFGFSLFKKPRFSA